MARIKIDFQDSFLFQCKTKVRVGDLNYGNHLANDKLLAIVHQARVEFFEFLNQSELDFFGTGLIMADSVINYKSQAYLNNNLLIEVGISNITRVAFDMLYRISQIETKTLVAEVKTGMVCFNYANEKVSPVPSELIKFLDN